MSDYLLFLSTQETDLQSALIRRLTLCDWSHVGIFRRADMWNFSAMNDGHGVAWRGPNPTAKILLLTHPQIDKIAALAFTQEGKPYNRSEILGFAANENLSDIGAFDCCQLVFWAAIQAGVPLLNHRYIPVCHLTPRDILLCDKLSEVK